ncbi:iron dicitrate transport regulator FecR [Pedobacter ginsengisoli]|uniref:Iron dicitrate transport regulator FecR n=1 Tax=Pedobacter ginsengisoli TaxID=363852 RepID=A0A2D1U0Z8_9SPHI|nr:FecR domain-containing protein [Pedobacter ginsengisoli]ATP55269.1 iron dicitrate transport regulator FecR [Pedobacter ginsengisoli]
MENQRLDELIEKYILKTATIQEQQELLDWYNTENGEEIAWLSEQLNEEVLVKQRLLLNINKQIQPKSKSVKLCPRIAAAAAILLVAGAGLFFFNSDRGIQKQVQDDVAVNDIAPGKNTATITLANGKTIQLSDAKTGVIIDATSLKYNDNTQVNTSAITGRHPELVSGPRTVQTPRGGTYQITLPDGTKVWLNAASSLSFPSTFQGLGNRKVELSGEAYFEVAKDKTHAFIVTTEKQEVEVLGTHFNINSYADEPNTKTTLLEGSVRVAYAPRHPEFISGSHTSKSTMDEVILKPNQQAILTDNTNITVKQVDPEDAIAWKNGYFMFNTETLQEVMNKVARWYDVNVQYQNPEVKKLKFSGTMSRYDNISQILKKIAAISNVSYSIKGKTVFLK